MSTCTTCSDAQGATQLKIDQMARWIESEWMPNRPEDDLHILAETDAVVHVQVLSRLDRDAALPGGYVFRGEEPIDCPVVPPVAEYQENSLLTFRTGASVYRFGPAEPETAPETASEPGDEQPAVEVLVVSGYFTDQLHKITLVCVPVAFQATWSEFANACQRLVGALEPEPKVRIIGGRSSSFVPDVDWDDIVLPQDLKEELMRDIESFFAKGIAVYQRLKLKPFRKLLLAGVPGTGKTMLCSALARWALARDYLVIYVSSADYAGASFWKIERALAIAADSKLPALILLEELDAYVSDDDEKALVLNVLDGVEARENEQGTLLIGTTNYPEAIDERVLKRPGRLDRIFIIPETRDVDSAARMLQRYLGDLWQDTHRPIAREMVGYPGAFIREVALYALTQMAYLDAHELSPDLLRKSFDRLLDQITAKDDFLTQRSKNGYGFVVTTSAN